MASPGAVCLLPPLRAWRAQEAQEGATHGAARGAGRDAGRRNGTTAKRAHGNPKRGEIHHETCSLQPGRLPGVDVPQLTYCSEGVANFDPS